MVDKKELRELVMERANGRCEWPGCHDYGTDVAHLTALGIGGTHGAVADYINSAANVAFLCRNHHMIQEGESLAGRKREVTELFRAYLRLQERWASGA